MLTLPLKYVAFKLLYAEIHAVYYLMLYWHIMLTQFEKKYRLNIAKILFTQKVRMARISMRLFLLLPTQPKIML